MSAAPPKMLVYIRRPGEQMTDCARQILQQALGRHMDGKPYALIDYPSYANPGDAAIWCGARGLLETAAGRAPSYVSTLRHFDADECRRAVAGGPVFFLGGGNFGSLYEKHHRLRLRAVEQIADQVIVLLPLSVAEKPLPASDPVLVARTREVFGGCARLTILSREHRSRAILRDVYGLDSSLCPDTAHGLAPPVQAPVVGLVRLARCDGEAPRRETAHKSSKDDAFDWSDDASLRWINRAGKLAPLIPVQRLRLAAFDHVARRKVAVACRLLGRGRVVATDRLHGVILADLMGREVIASDNATGKVRSYVETWAAQLTRVSLAAGEE
ncbi:hypothetical protein EJC49_21120 [Aquibium carbonis]|uniref:Polysaccharide pyruvyl transferase domain-containing protein n=1 Tax=Aquibium carbonis TaxID=2495581 RepID=A0A429YSK0_9HYPH|nr:polysaccharide pyruvyl transferase family protein [Aquibium carbonis]RST84436.1 hypothetical protein EJC49_21120 [Aquibium carbonis]